MKVESYYFGVFKDSPQMLEYLDKIQSGEIMPTGYLPGNLDDFGYETSSVEQVV